MIIDKLENMHLYSEIPQTVKDFVAELKPNISLGRVILSDDIYVNIETYKTKLVKDAKFEAHQKYIDIQLLMVGNEKIAYTDKYSLSETLPYDAERDIVFYNEEVKDYPAVCLDGTNFVMLFPHEAHAPQISPNSFPADVKKIVVKIKV